MNITASRRLRIISLAMWLGLASHIAWAQEQEPHHPEADPDNILTFSLENDLFSSKDNNYTNGVRMAFSSSESNIPDWMERGAAALPFFAPGGHRRWQVGAGQSMFTPSDLTRRDLQRSDRPYAGWLYGSFGLISDTGTRLDNLQLDVGVVGPSSLAAESQDFFHNTVGAPDPQGWSNQLKNEPGLVLTYERKWRGMYQFTPFGWGMDVTPTIGGSVGNVYTHAALGTIFRFGYDLPSDYGPPLIRPSLPGSDFFTPTQRIGWYLFAGVEGRAVGRNIFLDGNTFEDSHHVDKLPFVGGLQGGIAITVDGVRIAYTHIIRTDEFHGQQENDEFGALTVSFRF